MTAAQLSAEGDRLDKLGDASFRPLTPAERTLLDAARRRPGRKPKPAGERSERFQTTFDPALLSAVNAHVAAAGVSRSAWLQQLAHAALARAKPPASSGRRRA